jgi:hypothetical protein
VNITIDISDQTLIRALRLAHDRGISYWCSSVKPLSGPTKLGPEVKLMDQKYWWLLYDGKWILRDYVAHQTLVLRRAELERGLLAIVAKNPPLLMLMLDGAAFAEMGDYIIQYSLFGELRYARGTEPGVGAVYVCGKCQVQPPCDCLAQSGKSMVH